MGDEVKDVPTGSSLVMLTKLEVEVGGIKDELRESHRQRSKLFDQNETQTKLLTDIREEFRVRNTHLEGVIARLQDRIERVEPLAEANLDGRLKAIEPLVLRHEEAFQQGIGMRRGVAAGIAAAGGLGGAGGLLGLQALFRKLGWGG